MAKVATVLKSEAQSQKMNNGLSAAYRDDMSQSLSEILAATYRLTIKSHIYHWNVVGPLFMPLHELTEAHYNELFAAADVIAERVRALGHLAPDQLAEAAQFAPSGSSVEKKSAVAMVEDLIKDHETAVRTMREAAGNAGDNDDLVTEDMLTARLTFHEKALWMLRAHIA